MFDAKSLLENLIRGNQPAAVQGQPSPQGGGGLGDILGQILQGVNKGGAGTQSGGIGDILGQLQRSLTEQSGDAKSGGGGGLGDILAQLQAKLGAGAGGAGGLADVLGQVLAQAQQGVKEGAGRLDQATGASEAIAKATGQNPAYVLAKLQEYVKQNPLAAGTALGGLGGLVLGTRTGRAVAGSAARVGALAMIGGLAYKAFQNYQAGRPLITGQTIPEPAPAGSGFEPGAVTNEAAMLYIRAMIAAADADGRIDDAEQAKILGGLKQAGLDKNAEEFLANELNNPASVADLAKAVSTPEEAVQLYTAARIAIEPDSQGEQKFLAALASALGIDAKLSQNIDAATRSASA